MIASAVMDLTEQSGKLTANDRRVARIWRAAPWLTSALITIAPPAALALIYLLSGGAPLFTQPGDIAKWVAFDEIRAAQPDVILQFDCHGCPTARKHPIPRRPGWSELAAVARHAVYPLSANISDPNLCFPEALEELVSILNTYAA